MQLRYNFRLYPESSQCQALARAFGCARVVFNDGLRARRTARENGEKYLSDGELSKRVITQAKATPERVWLAEVSSVVLQQALADLNMAYRNLFASLSGKHKGGKVAPPRFRSAKDNRQAIRFTKNARFKIMDNGRLRLPKIGDVPVRWSRRLPADPSSVTVVKDAAGRYFASFVVQTTDDPLLSSDSEVGIDLGLTHFAVLSDGTKVAAPKFLRQAARKLKRLQQALSRKAKGSNRRRKAVAKVARAHARVADSRRDWQHKLSTAIIRDNQAVYVEDLCVVGLGRTRLAKSVHDAGWASFTAMLEYKAARYGRTFVRVDRFFPSTRMCSDCGRITEKLALDIRSWDCPCGSTHDRDVNAARNIKAAGQADFNDRGAWVKPAAMPAPRGEAVTHPDTACSPRGVEGVFVLSDGEDVKSPGSCCPSTADCTCAPDDPVPERTTAMPTFTTSDGVELDYRDRGGDGYPLVMLPGWGQTQAMFRHQFDDLGSAHRVITLDHRGHGRSAKPGHGYRIARLATDVNELLDHLGLDEVDALGWSMGVSLWWSLMDNYGTGRVRRFIAVDQPSAVAAVPWMTPQEQAECGAIFDVDTLVALGGSLAGPEGGKAREDFVRGMFPAGVPEDVWEFVTAELDTVPAAGAVPLLFDHCAQDWRDVLPAIDVPTLVMGAEVSHVSVSSQAFVADRIPGAKLHVFTADVATSHFPFLVNPSAFNAVVEDFLGN